MRQQKKRIKKGHGVATDIPNLFFAAATNNVKAIDAALKHYDINGRDELGMTALHHASAHCSLDAIDRLLKEPGVDATLVDKFNRDVVMIAIEVLGAQGLPAADRLERFCYPKVFEDIEKNLGPK